MPVPVIVALPEANVPVVDKFSSPKLIAPLLSVIEPSANVRVPIVEPVAADKVELIDAVPVIVALPEANVPVVDKFSSPKLIAPLLSVIEPSANVRVPIVEPVAADKVELIDFVPVIVALPEA